LNQRRQARLNLFEPLNLLYPIPTLSPTPIKFSFPVPIDSKALGWDEAKERICEAVRATA
jgi:hypothetical protein